MFSRACNITNVHPAQGLRVIKRLMPNTWATYLKKPSQLKSYQLSLYAAAKIKKHKICTKKPEHFLLKTNIVPFKLAFISNIPEYKRTNVDIHFIRTQRRYNKRRYTRVRATSRPPFWSGMMLSTLSVGAFWGSSIQSVDWTTTCVTTVDINTILALGYLFIIVRILNLVKRGALFKNREKNKSRRGQRFTMIKKYWRPLKW